MIIDQEIMVITEAIKSAIPVERIYLFGSYANGTPSESSDYDIFILIPDGGITPLLRDFYEGGRLICCKHMKDI